MSGVRPRMTHLFEQLGLDASEAAIQQFIETHQLNAETTIADAEFWTEAQRQKIDEVVLHAPADVFVGELREHFRCHLPGEKRRR